MTDAATAYFILTHLRLGALAAVHQKQVFIHGNDLGGRVSVESRYGRIITEDSYRKHEIDLKDMQM